MNIALIGFRGTGKTTLCRKLAKRLRMRFIDTDREIVKIAGKNIPQIFSEKGEEGFREIEKKAVEKVSAEDNQCIACGGGVALDNGNVENLKRNSVLILLEAGPETIFARIRRDRNRPALTKKNGMEEVLHLLNERRPFYEKAARFRVDTSDAVVEESVQEIIDLLNAEGVL